MFRAAAARPSLAALSRVNLRSPHVYTIHASACRMLSSTSKSLEYPKEGVFQKNSPPRNIPGFGPAPPSPHEQLPPQQDLFADHYNPPRRGWKTLGSALKFIGYFGIFMVGFIKTQTLLADMTPLEQESEEDQDELDLLFEELDQLLIVHQMREHRRWSEAEGDTAVWQEWKAYQGFSDNTKHQRLTTGPMGGSAGVAAQKVFYDEEGQRMLVFINFGPATQGFPQIVHGGAIITIFDEALGRFAIKNTEAKAAVTANLNVTFGTDTPPGQWHVLIVEFQREADGSHKSTDTKKYVAGFLACCNEESPRFGDNGVELVEGLHVHAEATGLFVVPKTTQLNQLPDDF